MDPVRLKYLQAMGIQAWVLRQPVGETGSPAAPAADEETLWRQLIDEIARCTACDLHKTRTHTVPGTGDRHADWMLIGEGPGEQEDLKGEPFVGRAGKLLDEMIRALGYRREQVYITNVVKCLRYNALVQLGDGRWERIGRLVRSRYSGEVMTVDRFGRLVRRKVTGWYESPLGPRRVFRLSYRTAKGAGKWRVGIQLTGDHEVLTQRGFVPVERLEPGDRIATGQGLSSAAFDVVCGTLLGDGTIPTTQASLTFSHSGKYRDYALFKAEILQELQPQINELMVAAVANGVKAYPIVRVTTHASRALKTIYHDFYPRRRKRVPAWMAERLNARMLAVWFMDDGHTRIRPPRQPSAEIATCGFEESDLAILVNALARLGVTAKVRAGRLHFGVCQTRRLSEIIAPFVPPCMRYKLHPEVADRIPYDARRWTVGAPQVFYDEPVIEEITDRKRSDVTFFCLDVEETHNFVTAGGVVHNCRPPGNRDPRPKEVAACAPFLQRQIHLVAPKIILAVGRVAAQALLKTNAPLARLRGKVHDYDGIPLIVIYHPAYLLRNPAAKRQAWEDLKFAWRVYQERMQETDG